MENTGEGQCANGQIAQPCKNWWTRLIGNIKSKLQQRKAKKQQESTADRLARLTANATLWMAVFTFFLASTSIGTVGILVNQLTEMRDEQRAWVGVQDTVAFGGFTEAEPWKVTVVFVNSGRTPARNVQSSAMFVTSPFPISGPSLEQVKQLQFRPAQSIAPQASYREAIGNDISAEGSSGFQRQGQQTLISQYQTIKNKELFLYYFGILKYDDALGKRRETQFCILLANLDTKQPGFCDAFNDLN